MDSSVTPYNNKPGRPERRASAASKNVVSAVRLAALQADGAIALAEHMLLELRELDGERRRLAQDDATLNIVLGEIEATAIAQCKKIQRDLYNPWGL